MNAAFLPSPPLPARAAARSRGRHAPRCPVHRAATAATLSIPHDRGAFPPGGGAFVHTEKTKRKIGETVMRRAAARRARARHLMVSLQEEEEEEEACVAEKADETDEAGEEKGRKPRRRLSAESRAKISAALKGRRKSAAHREALRARFEGDRNPMYGRKLSKESRAKISAAMTGRSQRRREQQEKTGAAGVSDEVIVDLRDKAATSRLFTGPKGKPLWKRRRCKDRMLEEQAEAKEIEELLTRVSRLDKPPANVARTLETNRKMREEEEGGGATGAGQSARCERCKATGFVKCPECVGAFGVASARCDVCFGAGAVFCEACQGVGEVATGGVC